LRALGLLRTRRLDHVVDAGSIKFDPVVDAGSIKFDPVVDAGSIKNEEMVMRQAHEMRDDEQTYVEFQRASELYDSGDFHAATVALERARDRDPDQSSIRELLARTYFRTGHITKALAEFETVIELDPVNDYAYFGRGMCDERRKEFTRALGNFRLAVTMRPEIEEYATALARVKTRMNE
jgi:tetratricopeptide (TPR) repeat protein